MFCNLREAIEDLKAGKIVCISDREDIENEIDMMCLGEYATVENINYMITNAKGLVCCPMSAEWCDKIGFEPMKNDNIKADKLGTPFYQSIDLDNGSTGISAIERSKTINHIASGSAVLSDFVSPGHLFTLRSKPGLLDERLGHTEFSVQMAELCESKPVAVICEVINNDGEMLRVKDFEEWNKDKGLKLYSIDKLLNYLRFDKAIDRILDSE